jgi:hypothetical protein
MYLPLSATSRAVFYSRAIKEQASGSLTVLINPLAALAGDFNGNGIVDAADYVVWRKNDGTQGGYDAWRSHFGLPSGNANGSSGNSHSQAVVPEPATAALLIFAAAGWCFRRVRAAQ